MLTKEDRKSIALGCIGLSLGVWLSAGVRYYTQDPKVPPEKIESVLTCLSTVYDKQTLLGNTDGLDGPWRLTPDARAFVTNSSAYVLQPSDFCHVDNGPKGLYDLLLKEMNATNKEKKK